MRSGRTPGLRCAAGGPQAHLGAPLFAHSQTPSPGQPLPCGQRARGRRPLWSSSGPTHPFGPRHQHTEEILEEVEAASLWATLGKGRCPAAPGGAPYNVCKLPGLMGPGLCPRGAAPWLSAASGGTQARTAPGLSVASWLGRAGISPP